MAGSIQAWVSCLKRVLIEYTSVGRVSNSPVRDLAESGYLTVRVKVTEYRVGPRAKYKAYLPESMNDVWELLRQQSRKRLAVVVLPWDEIAAGLGPKWRPLVGSRLMVRVGITAQPKQGGGRRYLVYLPDAYAELWRAVHRAGAQLRLAIDVSGAGSLEPGAAKGEDK